MQFNDLMDTARRGNVRAIDYGFNRMAQYDNRRDILFAGLFRNNGKDLVIDICITNACCKTYTPTILRYSRPRCVNFRRAENDKYLLAYKKKPLAMEMHGLRYVRHLQQVFQETSYRRVVSSEWSHWHSILHKPILLAVTTFQHVVTLPSKVICHSS
jgi:hypothetical protein